MITNNNEQGGIPPYLTVKDIQRIFRCGRDKAYKLCREKRFPIMVMYGTILIHPDSLRKWMDRNQGSTFK